MNLSVTCFGASQLWCAIMGLIWFWIHPEELARPAATNLMGAVLLVFSFLIMAAGVSDSPRTQKLGNKEETK